MKREKLPVTSQQALDRLMEGNARFVSGIRSVEAMTSAERLKDLAERGQQPFAVILTCSDSRVPAELIFDQGLGDLFVVRLAGNIAPPSAIATIEFAAMNLGTSLCVVMGHSNCGAIQATLASEFEGQSVLRTRNIEKLIHAIRPSVRAVLDYHEPKTSGNELARRSMLENVRRSVQKISRKSEYISELIQEGKFHVIGSFYDLLSGRVEFMKDAKGD